MVHFLLSSVQTYKIVYNDVKEIPNVRNVGKEKKEE